MSTLTDRIDWLERQLDALPDPDDDTPEGREALEAAEVALIEALEDHGAEVWTAPLPFVPGALSGATGTGLRMLGIEVGDESLGDACRAWIGAAVSRLQLAYLTTAPGTSKPKALVARGL